MVGAPHDDALHHAVQYIVNRAQANGPRGCVAGERHFKMFLQGRQVTCEDAGKQIREGLEHAWPLAGGQHLDVAVSVLLSHTSIRHDEAGRHRVGGGPHDTQAAVKSEFAAGNKWFAQRCDMFLLPKRGPKSVGAVDGVGDDVQV